MICCTSMSGMSRFVFFLHQCLTTQASPLSNWQGTLQNSHCLGQCLLAALLAMPALASSSARCSDHSAQLLRVAVADCALRSRMPLPSHFIEYLATVLVHLDSTASAYTAAHVRHTQNLLDEAVPGPYILPSSASTCLFSDPFRHTYADIAARLAAFLCTNADLPDQPPRLDVAS